MHDWNCDTVIVQINNGLWADMITDAIKVDVELAVGASHLICRKVYWNGAPLNNAWSIKLA